MIDTTKKYTYQGSPVRIYCDGSDTVAHAIHCAIQDDYGSWDDCIVIYEDDLELVWEPTPGELVLCWNDGDLMPNIRYFTKFIASKYWMVDNSLHSDFFGYKYCAQFTGTLPEPFKRA